MVVSGVVVSGVVVCGALGEGGGLMSDHQNSPPIIEIHVGLCSGI